MEEPDASGMDFDQPPCWFSGASRSEAHFVGPMMLEVPYTEGVVDADKLCRHAPVDESQSESYSVVFEHSQAVGAAGGIRREGLAVIHEVVEGRGTAPGDGGAEGTDGGVADART